MGLFGKAQGRDPKEQVSVMPLVVFRSVLVVVLVELVLLQCDSVDDVGVCCEPLQALGILSPITAVCAMLKFRPGYLPVYIQCFSKVNPRCLV